MNRTAITSAALVLAVMMASGCGREASVEQSLEKVPGLALLHVHVGRDMRIDLVPEEIEDLLPMRLFESLHSEGSFGVSLVGLDLTDLSPQLLFVTREVNAAQMLDIAVSGLGCEWRESPEGYDLVDERGSLRGSIAHSRGWTCLATGSGSDRTARRWTEMDASQSLAADIDLVSVSGSNAGLTLLVSRNSIAFLSVIPTGMLTRQQRSMLNSFRSVIAELGITALAADLDITDGEPPGLMIELRIAREGGDVTTLTAGFSDTAIPLDSLIRMAMHIFYRSL